MHVQPYLFFEGRFEEALAFYRQALGAQVEMMMRYKESPEPPAPGHVPPGSGDKIMHACFRIGDTAIMGSDGNCSGKPNFQGFALTLNADDPQHAQKLFSALADGGEVRMPLGKTFFSPSFGMVTDRFGLMWMVIAGA